MTLYHRLEYGAAWGIAGLALLCLWLTFQDVQRLREENAALYGHIPMAQRRVLLERFGHR